MNKPDESLVILTPGFPENEGDSTCLPAQQSFIRSLNHHFPTLEIIILTFQYPYTNATYQWHGNEVIPFNGRNKGNIHRLTVWFRVLRSLRTLKKRKNIIGLFSFWCTECALIGKYFGKFSGITHYCWILGQDAREGNEFIRFIHPNPSELVALSPFLVTEFYKNHNIKPAHIIPNGVDPGLFNTGNTERNIDILGAGSLIPLKQYDEFIGIVKEVTKYIPAVRAVICGKGPEKDHLRGLIINFNLENNVLLVGEKPHDEVLALMQRSKVFLHTSSYEGFSSVCLEALYGGAHVVSFCDPVYGKIEHWHIAGSREEMLKTALEILLSQNTGYEPVLAYSMDDSAKAVMKLFSG